MNNTEMTLRPMPVTATNNNVARCPCGAANYERRGIPAVPLWSLKFASKGAGIALCRSCLSELDEKIREQVR